jgi:hypothetical protein
MKYLLIAAALSLGFGGTCLAAQANQAQSNISQASSSAVTPQYPNAKHSKGLSCHMVGQKDVCKPM